MEIRLEPLKRVDIDGNARWYSLSYNQVKTKKPLGGESYLAKAEGLNAMPRQQLFEPVGQFAAFVRGGKEEESMFVDEGFDSSTDPNRALYIAVLQGHRDLAKKILRSGRPSPSNPYFARAVELAAQHGDVELLRQLLSKGGNAAAALEVLRNEKLSLDTQRELKLGSLKDNGNSSSKSSGENKAKNLVEAAAAAVQGIIQEAKAAVLRNAAAVGSATAVLAIIRKNWDLLQEKSYQVARVAAAHSNLEVMSALIDEVKGRDPEKLKEMLNASEAQGLRIAARKGDEDMVRKLIENGADIHAKGGQAFMQAVRHNHLGVVQLLMMGTEIPNELHARGIELAERSGHKDVCKFLKGWPMLSEDKQHILMGAAVNEPIHTDRALPMSVARDKVASVEQWLLLSKHPILPVGMRKLEEKAMIASKRAVGLLMPQPQYQMAA